MAEDDYDQFYKVDFFGGVSEVGYDGVYGGSTKRHWDGPCLLYLRFLWLLSQDAMRQVKVFRAEIAC